MAALRSRPGLFEKAFQALQMITPDDLLAESRVYGGGLYKLEPRELAAVSAEPVMQQIKGIRPTVQLSLGFAS